MKHLKKALSSLSGGVFLKAAVFLVFLGGLGVNLCMWPYWHNEPEMPQSMREE